MTGKVQVVVALPAVGCTQAICTTLLPLSRLTSARAFAAIGKVSVTLWPTSALGLSVLTLSTLAPPGWSGPARPAQPGQSM